LSGGRLAIALLAAALFVAPAHAQDELQRLDRLEEQLRQSRERQQQLGAEAERLILELEELRDGMIVAAQEVLRLEGELTAIETRLAGMRAEESVKAAAVQSQSEELAAVLASLARIARQPPETLIAGPGAAVDVVRSSMLLASVLPALGARAETLNAELRAVRGLRDEITENQLALVLATDRLEKQRETLTQMLEANNTQREQTQAQRATERARVADLAEQAGDLRELIGRLNEDENAGLALLPPVPNRSFAQARGQVPLPVQGQVVQRFGAVDALGAVARGLTVETRLEAQVVAPFDGKIVFAGPFRSYGLLLIIAHGEGYHTLIAGLSRIDAQVGQWLLSGEPIGVAGGEGAEKSTVYVELRHDGEPINPSPWFAGR
jgi:septal ring factor EnvC (AmiA/AmiB activator)